MAGGLITVNTLRLNTDIGTCQIELCVGDITRLRKEDKVDVVVVSAFPGDYSPTPSSLIGQLKIQLGLSVRDLSKDKEEDLRRQYFCWWSKPLPGHLSYRRLLCFEGGFGSRRISPPRVIGAVFRCLVPILKNKEGSVIMPLLSSGDQGYPMKLVLRQLLKAAVNWMKAGLPLRSLKIVIFSTRPEKKDESFEPLFQLFEEYKTEFESKDLAEENEKEQGAIHLYDIYLSHCTADHNTALQVKQFLRNKEDLKVFDDIQELNNNESWQDNIYNTMVKCSRVVTLISPGYLSSESCVEQYNMALCISRRKHKEVLAPFYVTTVEYLPTYMGLMQYIDCRPNDQFKLKEATVAIQQWLKENVHVHQEQAVTTEKPLLAIDYEVFISYSHCNKDVAYQLLDSLKLCDPNLHVFIDTAGLKTGTSWQQALFHAIDESRIMVALLSEDYFKSKVCKEEFSLASALHLDDSKDFKLVALLVENVKECPHWCSKPRPVDCASQHVNVTQLFPSVARSITNSLQGNDDLEERLAALNEDRVSIDEYMQRYRKTQFVLRKCLLSEPLPGDQQASQSDYPAEPQDTTQDDSTSVVALSFAEEDVKAALTMKQLLIEGCPGLQLSEPRTNATSRLKALDVAKVIIIMLSPEFMNSKELVEELNIALYRHRSTAHQVIYPIQLSPLPTKPAYIRLLPCDFAAMDYSWMIAVHGDKLGPGRIEHLANSNDISAGIAACLLEASELIVKRLTDTGFYEEHTQAQAIVNNLEVQKTWNQIRKHLAQEKGLPHLKLSFGVEVTTEGEHHSAHQDHHDVKSVDPDGKDNLGAHSSNTETPQKVPVEQDETDHGSAPLLQESQSPAPVDQVADHDIIPESSDHGQGQGSEGHVKQDLQNQTSGSGHQQLTVPSSNETSRSRGSYDLQNNPSGNRKTKSCSIL